MGGKRQKFPNIGWLVKLQSFKSNETYSKFNSCLKSRHGAEARSLASRPKPKPCQARSLASRPKPKPKPCQSSEAEAEASVLRRS